MYFEEVNYFFSSKEKKKIVSVKDCYGLVSAALVKQFGRDHKLL
jgi:hypothetical protein